MKRTVFKRKPWPRGLGTPEQRYEFKKAVHQADWGCVMVGRSWCDGPLDCCHVIPKQRLRKQGYGPEVIYSVDAAFLACRRHHSRHDNYIERIPDEMIPQRCRDFEERMMEP